MVQTLNHFGDTWPLYMSKDRTPFTSLERRDKYEALALEIAETTKKLRSPAGSGL